MRGFVWDVCKLKNPVRRYTNYYRRRGMSTFHDMVDWLGGYPYEFAKPAEVIGFVEARGFTLQKLRNAEYVFRRSPHGVSASA